MGNSRRLGWQRPSSMVKMNMTCAVCCDREEQGCMLAHRHNIVKRVVHRLLVVTGSLRGRKTGTSCVPASVAGARAHIL